MRLLVVYIGLLLYLQLQGCTAVNNSNDKQCIYSLYTYKYNSTAIFRYVPTVIINQTTLNIDVHVDYYQFQSDCYQSFIRLRNWKVNSYDNTSIDVNTSELEKSILQIFLQTINISRNSTHDTIVFNDYEHTKKHYRRMKIQQTNNNQFLGNSIFANYLLNKLFFPTKIICENVINLSEEKLENSTCQSTTAGLISIYRQIHFDRQIDGQIFDLMSNNDTFISSQQRTKTDFHQVLKQICSNPIWDYSLTEIINDEILRLNSSQYTDCEQNIIDQYILRMTRSSATEYILKRFSNDELAIEYHFDHLERNSADRRIEIFREYLNNSSRISNRIQLRMLIFIDDDNLTMTCVLNKENHWKYRAVALRIINNPMDFQEQFRMIFNDEQESIEIRILTFQYLSMEMNESQLNNLLEIIQADQLRLYVKSLFKQTSIWLGHSGSYEFPFGKMNLISNDSRPSIIQCVLANQTEIDLYFLENAEIWIIFGRKSLVRYSNLNDLWNWLKNARLLEIKTLDGFTLKIQLHIDFQGFTNLFQKSTAGMSLTIQHGLAQLITGYQIRLRLTSNFQIHIDRMEETTSYLWRAIDQENDLIKIEQTIQPFFGQQQLTFQLNSSASNKDFCYLIPHFDSKLCLSFVFERFWPSSIAIRLLADDPSLIYNFTLSNHSLLFHIQQNEQISRSYRLLRRYDHGFCMPNYLALSTPTTNYTVLINRSTSSNNISLNFLRNNHSISHGSGMYEEDLTNQCAIHLTEIHPKHIGTVFIRSSPGNLTINARKLLGGELKIHIEHSSTWKSFHVRIDGQRTFFFFPQNFSTEFSIDLDRSSYDFTLIRNENDRLQWNWMKNTSHFYHLFLLNTTWLEFNYQTQGYYHNYRNMAIESSSSINGWTLWNINGIIHNGQQLQLRLNQRMLGIEMNSRMILLQINSSLDRIVRIDIQRVQLDSINILLEMPGYRLTSKGKISSNYTNITLDFPIIENEKKHSHIHLIFSSSTNHLLCNLTSHIRNRYTFHSQWNITFLRQYLFQSTMQSSLKMLHYPLFAFDSFAQFLSNSTILQSFNSSFILPSLFVAQPFRLTFEKDSHLFIQFFEWVNITRLGNHWNLSTIFGLELSLINDLPFGLSLHLEQRFLGHRYFFIFQIDRHWLISITINRQFRYELISSPVDSMIFIQRINLPNNEIHRLPIHYYTDNQTLIRIEVQFSKYFSRFINDFLLDISWKNQTWKCLCHIPLFRREFFLFTWTRIVQKEFGHFQGIIDMKFLRRRRLFNYQYDWNLASIRFWQFDSSLILFSFDPIQWKMNITNDYFWNGLWMIHSRLILGHRRELIRFHHQYYFQTFVSNLLFNLSLINSHYDLNVNYYHHNHSIDGLFVKNRERFVIDGYWNRTKKILQLNTQDIKSITIIRSNFFKSFIEKPDQKIGILFERTSVHPNNESQLFECNPSLIIHRSPQLFLVHYYTLNDGLSSMIVEWTNYSYLSWNYTGHSRIPIPWRNIQIDLRRNSIFRLDTITFEYELIYHYEKRQLVIRREPRTEDADDRLILKMKSYRNETFLIDLQVINNHYEIIGDRSANGYSWYLHGHFQKDQFNGSLIFSDSDWFFSSKFDFNSSLLISTGRYVQFIPTSEPQIALEILLRSRWHCVFQYAGFRSLIVGKLTDHSSNFDLYFLSKSLDEKRYHLQFQLNELIKQNWTLEIHNKRYSCSDERGEFLFNGSLDDFTFRHILDERISELIINEHVVEFSTNQFHFLLANLSSETSRYIHLSHQPSKQNLTIQYYKSGRFARENFNIQTPIYDVSILYYPSIDDQQRYVKLFFEFLPLQMSAFNFVRGRTFRIGYESQQTRCILSGNLALGIDDIDNKDLFTMNERWKFIYGYERNKRIYIKWNLKFNLKERILRGRVNIEDPNGELTSPIYSDIYTRLEDTMLITDIRTIYASADELSKVISLQLNIDDRFQTQQYLTVKLIHELSRTNLSLTLDRYPQRRFVLRLKPNDFLLEKTLVHLYANTTESQLKLLLILADLIHLNLTLPKSYPETGILHSSIIIDNEEYFDGRLDPSALKLRSKDYFFNVSLNELVLQKRITREILASIIARWIDRNSSTGLLTIFSQTDFQRIVVPIEQSAVQPTWLRRLREFVFSNNLTIEFSRDLNRFLSSLKADFLNEQKQFSTQMIEHLQIDENLQTGLQTLHSHTSQLIGILYQISLFGENLFQEYLNNLTCLIHHQNLFHLDISQLTILVINTFTYQIMHYVNRTSIIFNHFTRYSHSSNAMIHYLSNELILQLYRWINQFYLETKEYFLSKFLQYSQEIDFIIKISPLLSDSITFLSSNDLRASVYFINDRLYRLVSIWRDSPLEYKFMKTVAMQSIEFIERIRFYLDDKLDFLLPILKIYTPQIWINQTMNQTFLLTWSKQSD